MAGARTLLLVHAHPDDEALATGGTIARYSADGARTVLVVATRGEAGEISDATLATPENLGAVRERELAEAARHLGVVRLVQLGYRDSGMAGTSDNQNPASFHQADLRDVVKKLVALIRAERPEVVITYDENGSYGHPDHVKAHVATVEAFGAAGDAARFPDSGLPFAPRKLYYTALPHSQMVRFAEAMQRAGFDRPAGAGDADQRRPPMGVPDEAVTTEIDVSGQIDRKLAAIAAHRTQTGPGTRFGAFPPDLARSLWTHEYYQRIVGPTDALAGTRETDLFAGLD